MHGWFWRTLAIGLAAGTLTGCADGRPPADRSVGPTLSLNGASGVSAEVSRTVSLRDAAGEETVVSAVDTAVWAPFNEDGAALASAPDAGMPGPLGWRASGPFPMPGGNRYASFRDSAGVLHELRVTAEAPGPWTRVEYRRAGLPVLDQQTTWTAVDGGWVVARESATYHLAGSVDLRIDLQGRRMRVAQARRDLAPLASAGAWLGGLLAPRPLAAQFYFGACSGDWLKWMGTALLAELAWGKFAKSRLPTDFKKAVAATSAAGVALNGLLDCMLEQPEEPDPGY